MAYRGRITVRTRPVGGAVAATATPLPDVRWLLGRRQIVLLIHGYNVDESSALKSYGLLFGAIPADVGYFLWPGDTRGWIFRPLVSGGSYPWQIPSAMQSAARLATLLRGLFGPEGGPTAVSLIGHSLGCRLVLEVLKLAAADPTAWPPFPVVALMAAAVPVALVDRGGDLEPATRLARKLALLYSGADDVLRLAFPEGQAAARLLGYDSGGLFASGDFDRAVGSHGEPAWLTALRFDMTPEDYGHGSYWGPDPGAVQRVAPLFGVAAARPLAARSVVGRSLPGTRTLPPMRFLPPTRSLPVRGPGF